MNPINLNIPIAIHTLFNDRGTRKRDREEEEELIKVGFKYYQFYQEGGTYLIGVY